MLPRSVLVNFIKRHHNVHTWNISFHNYWLETIHDWIPKFFIPVWFKRYESIKICIFLEPECTCECLRIVFASTEFEIATKDKYKLWALEGETITINDDSDAEQTEMIN